MPHRPFSEVRAERDARDRAAGVDVDALEQEAREGLALQLAAHNAGLAQVRRARGLTQTQLARVLGVSQAQVSRIESQADLFLSTLASYLEAMGGELELVGVFDGQRVALELGDLARSEAAGVDLITALQRSLSDVESTASMEATAAGQERVARAKAARKARTAPARPRKA